MSKASAIHSSGLTPLVKSTENPADNCVLKTMRAAAIVFILLSGGAAYYLHHTHMAEYLFVPAGIAALSLIALCISYCTTARAHRPTEKQQGPKGTSSVARTSLETAKPPLLQTWIDKPLDTNEVSLLFTRKHLSAPNAPILLFGDAEGLSFNDKELVTLRHNGYVRTYDFLSNRDSCIEGEEIELGGQTYKSVKSLFESALADTPMEKEDQISLMKVALWKKFNEGQSSWRGAALRATGKRALYCGEESDHDWGCAVTPLRDKTGMISVTVRGNNLVGKLLMELREMLQKEAQSNL